MIDLNVTRIDGLQVKIASPKVCIECDQNSDPVLTIQLAGTKFKFAVNINEMISKVTDFVDAKNKELNQLAHDHITESDKDWFQGLETDFDPTGFPGFVYDETEDDE